MRRLIFLIVAVALGWAAATLMVGGDGASIARMRDGGVLALAAALIAGWWALPAARFSWTEYAWPNAGRALFVAGLLTALLGAGVGLAGDPDGRLGGAPLIVWAIGVGVLVGGALLRGEVTRYAAPAFRWERDAVGGFVRVPLDASTEEQPAGRTWRAVLAAILVAGTALRLWLAWRLPPVCSSWECAALLGDVSSSLSPLSRALFELTSLLIAEPLWALRLTAVLASCLTLPAFVLLLGRFASTGGLLAGAALFAFNPWLVDGGQGGAGVEGVLLVLLALWGSVAALQASSVRGWAAAGLALGLLVTAAPTLFWAWAAWMVCLVLLALTRPDHRVGNGLWVLAGSALGGLSGTWATGAGNVAAMLPALAGQPWLLASQLSSAALLVAPLWLVALTIAGAGVPARLGRGGVLVLLTFLAAACVGILYDGAAGKGREGAALLGAWGALFAALAVDQLLSATQRAWRPLVQPRTFTAWATAVVVVVSLFGVWQAAQRPARTDSLAADDRQAIALAAFAREFVAEPANEGAVLLAPAAFVAHPSVRLGAAELIRSGRLIGLDRVAHVPWMGDAPGGVVYVVPPDQPGLADLLRTIYPEGSAGSIVDAEGDALDTWRVDPATLFESAGLEQYVYAGREFGSADQAQFSSGVGPLQFDWGESPPLEPTFSVEWQGSLIARESGVYTFSVIAPHFSLFSLILDDRLVLDTSAGLLTRGETLPAGAHSLKLQYRSETLGDLALLWQPPGGDLAPIPREALFNPPLPVAGLVGAYMASDDWSGPAFTLRQDAVIEADPSLPRPWSAVWQGHLAAPRAGEYLLGMVSSGPASLAVDGMVVANRAADGVDVVDAPAEGLIYLERGWHPIEVRFSTGADEAAPEIKLYWQPPGSTPAPLPARALSPSPVELGPADTPLPEVAPSDERLGTADFALSADPSLWQPQVRIPPRDLPALPFARVWSAASCGAGPEYLNSPHGLAVDPERGRIYVADTGNRRVVALSIASGSAAVLPIEGLAEPVDVALQPDGRLVVLDTELPKIVRFDPDTVTQTDAQLAEGFYRPRGIAVDALGLLYVADTGGARVVMVDEAGAKAAQFGGPDSVLGRGQPVDVVAPGEAIWAITAEHGRLWQLGALGSYTAVQPTDTIHGPHLAATADRLFLSDPARQQVIVLDERGRPLGALADEGAFALPTGVAAWQEGEATLLAVADTAACAVSLWRAEGGP